MVVDQHDADHVEESARMLVGTMGIENRNEAPWASEGSTQIRPPCASTICWAM
jgi:hypothetical protein